jgi:hypothetical protein
MGLEKKKPASALFYLGEQLTKLAVSRAQAFGQAFALVGFHAVERGVNAAQGSGYIVNVVDKADKFSSGGHEKVSPVCLGWPALDRARQRPNMQSREFIVV